MIRLRDITKVYNAGRSNEFRALGGVSLEIEDAKVTAIVGPSGSGKTTLLSIMGCMSRPTSGRAWVEGTEVTSLPERFLTGHRRRTFGFIFQQFNLVRGLTALENAMLPAYPTGESWISIRERALSLFEHFSLAEKAHDKVQWLSGGQAQRVAVIRALINDPHVIIADEPTANLDTRLSAEIMGTLGQLNAEGRTVIITSHDPSVYSSEVVHRALRMRDGLMEEA
jgi:putative ABC transport system ATP-binding protein